MMENKECIFCKIANKEIKSFTIYEDLNFISFLSIYPNTPGVAVVIPRKHYGSDIFSLENNVINDLMSSVKNVAKILENSFEDVGRVGLVFEGLGINHLHAKLYPFHGTREIKNNWKEIKSSENKFFTKYEGYVSSHDCESMSANELEEIYKKIMDKKNVLS